MWTDRGYGDDNLNKEESLAFLQNCIEKVKRATAQDIQFYKEVYDRECDSKERMSEREEETEISKGWW